MASTHEVVIKYHNGIPLTDEHRVVLIEKVEKINKGLREKPYLPQHTALRTKHLFERVLNTEPPRSDWNEQGSSLPKPGEV